MTLSSLSFFSILHKNRFFGKLCNRTEKTSNPITNKWLLQYLKSPSFNRFIQKENAGGTQKFIALGLIRDMKLRVPEFDEQQKIGAFFKKIDETITLHQRKLDLLKEQKKGFLQKMFV
ncbi:restriction endonuclease subunit S [Leuconostoc mesenteroides]|uniref:restriction endonuclease subunit S n=1 Tax=Leuconostoc mesenteroides TaxID=1245 RepID=UPI0009BDDAE6